MKEKLIHMLGGYTEQEMNESSCRAALRSARCELATLRAYMRDLNGEDAETWCDLVWKCVCARIDTLRTRDKGA